jgi:ParB family transcriptional regulator, chromosome partitioning protein
VVKSKFGERASKSLQSAIVAKEDNDKILELQQKISLLTEEAANKEELLKELRFKLEQQSGKASIAIDKIKPSDQCRVTFTEATIERRCKSLLSKGQLEPLILIIPKNDSPFYYLEDGEVTWRAACKLVEAGENNWTHLEAVFSNLSPEENVHRRTLIHHLHSESLTPLDRAEAIVREMVKEINTETEEIAKLLRNIKYKLEKSSHGKILIEQGTETEIESMGFNEKQLLTLAFLRDLQVDFSSFVGNDLDLVFLCDDLKDAARNRGLGCYQAKILNRLQPKNLDCEEVKAKNLRVKATEQTITERLNKADTRKLVSSIVEKHCPSKAKKPSQNKIYKNAIDNVENLSVEELQLEQLEHFQAVIQQKLAIVEQHLATLTH